MAEKRTSERWPLEPASTVMCRAALIKEAFGSNREHQRPEMGASQWESERHARREADASRTAARSGDS